MKKILLLASAIALSACGDDGAPKDYLKIAGGGIVFNYRVSEAGMVVVAQQIYPLPAGSTVTAEFEHPDKSPSDIATLPALEGKLSYKLQSVALMGFKKGGEYKVIVRLVDNAGKQLDQDETKFTSDEDQSTLPSKPLVEGPALTPHLENLK
jgi:hypothetical protein